MSKELRDVLTAFKTTNKERKKLERSAKAQGMDLSNYIRWKLIYKDKEGGGGQ